MVLLAAGLIGACSGQTPEGETEPGEAAVDSPPAAAASAPDTEAATDSATAPADGVSAAATEAAAELAAAIERPNPKPVKVIRASGKAAPDFELTLLNGDTFRLSENLGKVVILNFWGSWCPPCRWEMPDFQEMYQEYRDDGVLFVGVAVPPDDEADARAFAEKIGVTYPVGLDPEGVLLIRYRVTSFPTTFIIFNYVF